MCLEGVFSAELFKNVIGELDVLRVFRYLDSLGLTPFIRVEEDMAFDAVESALSRLSHQEMAGRKVPGETGIHWRFELKETGTERSELLRPSGGPFRVRFWESFWIPGLEQKGQAFRWTLSPSARIPTRPRPRQTRFLMNSSSAITYKEMKEPMPAEAAGPG